jgi:uncharacterized protein
MKKDYAIITGAAEGLGRSFALACASQGYHLILVDLPFKKLPQLASHIAQTFGNDIIVVEKDLCAKTTATEIANIVNKQHLSVGLLINNAGIGLSKTFESLHDWQLSSLLQLNVQSLTQVTYALLHALKQHGDAIIINVSSLASYFPLPYKSIYAASKAYVRFFSQALRIELKQEGVHVCTLCPGAVASNSSQYITAHHSGWFVRKAAMHPDEVASIALKAAFRKKALVIPGFLNRTLLMLTHLLPAALKDMMAIYSMKSVTGNSKLLRFQLYPR